jgi:hypothetical protein
MEKLDSRESIPGRGAELIGKWWDDCKQIRIDYPEPGDKRNAAFERGQARCERELNVMGLSWPANLPPSKEAAMAEAYKRFRSEV